MKRSIGRFLATASILVIPVPVLAAGAQPLDEARLARAEFGGDAGWYINNIPFFDSSDSRLTKIYYYRWKVFRSHQRDLGTLGYITTEFLDDVSWQRQPYASLNDASGFHIEEGRWLRDRRFVDDYINYLLDRGGNDRHFSESISGAVYSRFLVDGDLNGAARHLGTMKALYDQWNDHWDATKQLYWIEPLYDATEYTISAIDASGGIDGFFGGQAFRPSINAYMFANAQGISRLANLVGDTATAQDYGRRAASLKKHVESDLWNPKFDHFLDRYQVTNQSVRYWDQIRGRELVGYLPWTYGMVDETRYASAWQHILNADQLRSPFGLRTVEPSYPYYMHQYRYDGPTHLAECQWNGPIWPFQTTQVLQGMARLLRGPSQSVVNRGDYVHLLRQYADLHMVGDHPDIQEDYDPATGKPIVGLPRSHHYMHSAFDDLIITGLAGIVPREDDILEVDPLLPQGKTKEPPVSWFALQDVPYHGHRVTIVWDKDGNHFHLGAGLRVMIDDKTVTNRPTLGRLELPLVRQAPAAITRRVDLAVNLVAGEFPRGAASVNDDPISLHQALDGRVWFFPEQANGWSTAGSDNPQDWFEIDFGKPVRLSGAELDFLNNGKDLFAPDSYKVQWWDGAWRDMPMTSIPAAVANGPTDLAWPTLVSQKLRVVVKRPTKGAVRLVEFKVF